MVIWCIWHFLIVAHRCLTWENGLVCSPPKKLVPTTEPLKHKVTAAVANSPRQVVCTCWEMRWWSFAQDPATCGHLGDTWTSYCHKQSISLTKSLTLPRLTLSFSWDDHTDTHLHKWSRSISKRSCGRQYCAGSIKNATLMGFLSWNCCNSCWQSRQYLATAPPMCRTN